MFYWHIHHDVLVEYCSFDIEERIDYIKKHKPADERNLRLALLKPATIPESNNAWTGIGFVGSIEELYKYHAEQCDPNCPWESIFQSLSYKHKLYGNIFNWYNAETLEFVRKPQPDNVNPHITRFNYFR